MKKLLYTCVCACMFLFGCRTDTIPGNHYTVYIDPAFSDAETESVVKGLDSWVAVIPSLRFSPIVSSCSGFGDGEICIHRSNLVGVVSHHGEANYLGVTNVVFGNDHRGDSGGYDGKDGGEVWLDMNEIAATAVILPSNSDVLAQSTAHEIGHAMGLIHHNGYFLMNANIQGSAQTPMCDDINQWYYVRFQNSPACIQVSP